MLSKIQKHLLLNHPLLWNLKVVHAVSAAVIINILFFITGYINGAVDFKQNWSWRNGDEVFTVFFSIFVALLFLVIWLVYYFRNNALKSFYPISRNALFREWLIILVICFLNCFYSASYMIGSDLHKRTYFTETEFARRINVISAASIFAGDNYSSQFVVAGEYNEESQKRADDYVMFDGKRYDEYSTIGKDMNNFMYNDRKRDSVLERKIKQWLVTGKRDSLTNMMNEFFDIAKSHGFKPAMTADKWYGIFYTPPGFMPEYTVGERDVYIKNKYGYRMNVNNVQERYLIQYDTKSNRVVDIPGEENSVYMYPKYHIPMDSLKGAYDEISASYVNPYINAGIMLVYLYFALALSLAIFSFRVTSGRSWLYGIIILGLIGILSGIFGVLSSPTTFFVIWILIILALLVYFYAVFYSRPDKGNGRVPLNLLLWLLPSLLPLLIETLSAAYGYPYTYGDNHDAHPIHQFIEYYRTELYYLNIVLFVAYMYFFTGIIRNWMGKPEA